MSHDGAQSQRADGAFYFTTLDNGWIVGRFRPLDKLARFTHAVTTRQAIDVASVRTDHPRTADDLKNALGLCCVGWLDQIHGADVVVAGSGGYCGKGDALVSDIPLLGLAGRSADCPLILLADPVTGAVGVAHASWRGTVKQIAMQLVSKCVGLLEARPDKLVACICPSAGPCCFEVGPDVLDTAVSGIGEHARMFFVRRGGRMYFDLWSANVNQLMRAGLKAENIHVAGVCTMCRNDIFPSHRKEGDIAGRFVAVIASNR